jgi:hypothetical protein
MSLRVLSRKTKMQLMSTQDDVCQLLFAQKKTQIACRLFLKHLKQHGDLTRVEFSKFVHDLHDGKIQKGFHFERSVFYRTIRKTLINLGLITIEQRFVDLGEADLSPERVKRRDVVNKYVAVRQPIGKRPPDGVNLVRLTWIIAKRWNDEFLKGQ